MAPLFLQLGDMAGCRKHCHLMLERFGGTTDPVVAERTAKACLLVSLPEPDRNAACRLAERAAAMARSSRHWVLPWALVAEALGDYRGGRFVAAVARVDECLSRRPGYWDCEVPAHLVRAMALHRLGRIDGAWESLRRAAETLQARLPRLDSRAFSSHWHDWLICGLLRREAEALIEPPDLPPDPFAR
jgi:serine/threonine-protein kinase